MLSHITIEPWPRTKLISTAKALKSTFNPCQCSENKLRIVRASLLMNCCHYRKIEVLSLISSDSWTNDSANNTMGHGIAYAVRWLLAIAATKNNQTFRYLLFRWELQLLNPILLIISGSIHDFRFHTQPFVCVINKSYIEVRNADSHGIRKDMVRLSISLLLL